MRMTEDFARSFATSWYAAWNAHDLDAIMACYEPDIQHSSPFIKRYNAGMPDENDTALRGIDRVRDYFRRALERNPTLRFDPMHMATGLESVILVYRRMSGDLAAELFAFDEQWEDRAVDLALSLGVNAKRRQPQRRRGTEKRERKKVERKTKTLACASGS
jgi:hypothetical protein